MRVFFLGCLVILLFGLQETHAEPFSHILKKLYSFDMPTTLLDKVNQNIVGKIQAKDIKYVLPNKLVLHTVEVLDQAGNRVLYASKVSLSVSLPSLLSSNIKITAAHIVEPYFSLVSEKGLHNVVQVFQPKNPSKEAPKTEAEKPLRVSIEDVKIENGRFEMRHDAGVLIVAEGIAAQGQFYVENGSFVAEVPTIQIARGAVHVRDLEFPIQDLNGQKALISNEQVSLQKLTAFYERALLFAQGTVFIKKNAYDLYATLKVPKNTWPSGLPTLPFDIPAFTSETYLTGPLEDPQIKASIVLEPTHFLGWPISGGTVKAQINKDQIAVDQAVLRIGQKGTMDAHGIVNLQTNSYDFFARHQALNVEDLLSFLGLKTPASGTIAGETHFLGSFSSSSHRMDIHGQGTTEKLRIHQFQLLKEAQYEVSLNLDLGHEVNILSGSLKEGRNFSLKTSGHVQLDKEKNVTLAIDADVLGLKAHLSDKSIPFDAEDLHTTAELQANPHSFSLKGFLNLFKFSGYGFVADELSTNYSLDKTELKLDELYASLHHGSVMGELSLGFAQKDMGIKGNFAIKDAEIQPMPQSLLPFSAQGLVSGQVDIKGTVSKPEVQFSGLLTELEILQFPFGRVEFSGTLANGLLQLPIIKSYDESNLINIKDFSLDLVKKTLAGRIYIQAIELSRFLRAYVPGAFGYFLGDATLGGTLAKPQIIGAMTFEQLEYSGLHLGSGALSLDISQTPSAPHQLAIHIATLLQESQGISKLEAKFFPKTKVIDLALELSNVPFESEKTQLSSQILPFSGDISGKLSATGTLDRPKVAFQFAMPTLHFHEAASNSSQARSSIAVEGPVLLHGDLDHGAFKAEFCAFAKNPSQAFICSPNHDLRIVAKGSLMLPFYRLQYEGNLHKAGLQQFSTVLQKEFATLDIDTAFSGTVEYLKNKPLQHHLHIHLEHLRASAPGIPLAILKKPADIELHNQAVRLKKPVSFQFEEGELSLQGDFDPSNIAFGIKGTIPLALARFVSPIVNKAQGLASGEISLSGTLEQISPSGSLTIEPGALISLGKWLEPIEVKKGEIEFQKRSTPGFVAVLKDVQLGVGDGSLTATGSFRRNYNTLDRDQFTEFHVDIVGHGILVRDGQNFIESEFSLHSENKDNKPILTGTWTITDGFIHRDFDLRNFIASASKSSTSEAFLKTLKKFDIETDLQILIRQFQASIQMLSLHLATSLQGQIRVLGNLSAPKLSGGITLIDASIQFPSTKFEFPETLIPIESVGNQIVPPQISLSTTAILERQYFPIQTDTTVELKLTGTPEQLNLSLRPIVGDMSLSQLRIFLLLLSPQFGNLIEGRTLALAEGARNAALAFSATELFLKPLTNEIQSLLYGKTGTRIQFGSSLEAGGLLMSADWTIGRIQLHGSYAYRRGSLQNREKGQSFFATGTDLTPLSDIRLRLLLFDHLPIGKQLFLESEFETFRYLNEAAQSRGKIYLKYRVLQQ